MDHVIEQTQLLRSAGSKAATQSHFRAALAAVIGNAFECYDFFLYTTAAALVFGRIFFPTNDPAIGTLISLGSFAVGFVTRPLGGFVFGHIGDRFGRKVVMIWTLSLMGGATFLVGLLPSFAQVGILAPIGLIALRLLQGFSAGGEWGGAILMTTENAPTGRRGQFGAWSQAGTGFGFVLASGAFFLVQQLPTDQLLSWGWRLPFLASPLIFSVGIYIRTMVAESEEYQRSMEEVRSPLKDVLTLHWREIIVGALVRLSETCGSFMMTAFALAYGAMMGVQASLMLLGVMAAMLVDTAMMIVFGRISDLIGRRKVYLAGIIGMAAVTYPVFTMIASGSPVSVFTALILANGFCHAAMVGVLPSLLTELFPVRVRQSGLGFAHGFVAIVSGMVPLTAMSLYTYFRSPLALAAMMCVICLTSAVALAFAKPFKHTM